MPDEPFFEDHDDEEELEIRTTSESDSGGNEETSFVDALAQFASIMADLKQAGNPAIAALLEKHPDDDEDDPIFSPAFKAKCRALLAARDYAGMLEALLKDAKADRDAIEMEVFEMFEAIGDDENKVTGTVPVPLGEPYGTVKFKARATYYAKIIDDEKLQEYLEERAMVDGYVAPKFEKGKLNGIVRDEMEKPHPKLPPGLSYTVDRGVTVTRR